MLLPHNLCQDGHDRDHHHFKCDHALDVPAGKKIIGDRVGFDSTETQQHVGHENVEYADEDVGCRLVLEWQLFDEE